METSTSLDYLARLNPEQLEAVRHFEGPLLVLAGAGSGKTRVLTSRIAHLIGEHGAPPNRILAVTFTNKAAGEMRERVAALLEEEPRGMWMGTFHAIGARLLRRHAELLGWTNAFTIFDADQSLRQIKRIQESVGVDPSRWKPKAIRAHISGAKNELIGPQQFVEDNSESFDVFARMVAKVYPAYQTALKQQNAFDFDDLLVKPVELFQGFEEVLERYSDRFAFVLVDEYQDTNHAQFQLLELLSRTHSNLMVVGDDDQSIYGWRGADIRNILEFESVFPGARVVRLERNYRSTERILEAANAVIAENVERKGKTLRTERLGGDTLSIVETVDEVDEARWIADEIETRMETEGRRHRDFSILYRTNAQSRALEDTLRRRAMPYQIVGGVRFYERREIQDVLAYLRLISNPKDEGAFARVVNYPRRGIGRTSQERLERWARESELPLLEAAARASEATELPAAGARSLERFADLIRRYSGLAAQMSVGDMLQTLVEELEIPRHLREEGPDGEDRAENVLELIAGALEFEAEMLDDWEDEEVDRFSELDLFLQQVALVADVDAHDGGADVVTLMTLHNAKGLEFPCVFISGMEDGLFPLARSFDEPKELEEERRLMYVGITRAEDKLYFTYARQRRRAGELMFGKLSSFASSIPHGLVDFRKSRRLAREAAFIRRRPDPRERTPEDEEGIDAGPDLDADMNQELPRFVKGERVAHATFGSGSVKEILGFGRDLKVTVDFDGVGRKRLLVRYAGLQKAYD